MDRIDPEPPEPFLTLPEGLVVGGLAALVVFGLVCWRFNVAIADFKRWFDEVFGGL